MKHSELLTKFLDNADVQDITRSRYNSSLKPFFLWLVRNNLTAHSITRTHIIQYKSYLTKTFSSIYTVRNYFNAVQLFYNWMELTGLSDNVTAGIRRPRIINQILSKLPLTFDQVKKLKQTIDRSTPIGCRDYAIISLTISLGLRVSEVVSIDISDIEYLNNTYVLSIKGKGYTHKIQRTTVPTETIAAIEEYKKNRLVSKTNALFVSFSHRNPGERITKWSIQHMVKSYLERIGLTGRQYSTHSLRHTSATLALLNGAKIEQVQRHMRHTSPNTTQIYLRYIIEQQYADSSIAQEIESKTKISDPVSHTPHSNGYNAPGIKSII